MGIKRIVYIIFIFSAFLLTGCKTIGQGVASKHRASEVNEAQHIYNPTQIQLKYYLYEALRCYQEGQYDEAMSLLLFCQQLDPQDAATQQYLGYIYELASQTEIALSHYKRAFANAPISYWNNYTALSYKLGQMNEAVSALEKVAGLQPKNLDVLNSLCGVYQEQEEYKKALKVLNQIEKIEGQTRQNAISRYEILYRQGKVEKSLQVIDQYVENNPDELYLRTIRANTYMSFGKEKEALDLFDKELSINPDNPYVFFSLCTYYDISGNKQKSAEYARKGILSEQLDMYQKLNFLQQLTKRLNYADDIYVETVEQLIEEYPLEEIFYTTLAQYYLVQTDYNKAMPLLQTALDINAEANTTWRTILYIMQHDTATAYTNEQFEDFFNRAYQQMPENLEWAYWKVRTLVYRHELDSALAIIERVSDIQGDIAYRLQLKIIKGDIYNLLEDMPNTYKAYEEVLAIDPNNIYVLNNYAYMLAIHDGDIKKAEMMSRKTIEAEPTNATYLDTYAWILHLQGQEFLAKYYIEQAKEYMSEDESEEILLHYLIINGLSQ